MLDCTLKCTVCKQSFKDKSTWLEHLLTQEHQAPANIDCSNWDEATRECVLVVFCTPTLPVACMEVLLFFSSFGALVTDFVWNPSRSTIGIFQYESRESVNEIFDRGTIKNARSEVRIHNSSFQIKKASSMLPLEWNSLVFLSEAILNSYRSFAPVGGRRFTSSHQNASVSNVSTSNSILTTNVQERVSKSSTSTSSTPPTTNRKGANNSSSSSSSSSSSDDSSNDSDSDTDSSPCHRVSSSTNGTNITSSTTNCASNSLNSRTPPVSHRTSTNANTSNSNNQSQSDCPTSTTQSTDVQQLKSEPPDTKIVAAKIDKVIRNAEVCGSPLDLPKLFSDMFKKIVIPKSRYMAVCHLLKMMKEELTKHYPSLTLVMFRHWYLEMITMGNPEILIFVDSEGFWKDGGNPEFVRRSGDNLNKKEILKILDSSEFKRKISGFKKMDEDRRFKLSDPIGTVYLHESLGNRFNLVFDQGLIPEAQTSRLLKYLTVFDPLVLPLLKVVRCWAKTNKIRFAKHIVTDPHSPNITPEPSGMEWLVMFFLMHERLIPSPREISARPHKPLIYRCPRGCVDIGFSVEGNYHKTWAKRSPNYTSTAELLQDPDSDAFHLSVFKLAWQFFTFYSTRINRWERVVVNMRDGEILKINDVLHKKPGDGWETKLEPPEITILKNIPSLKNATLFLLHPLSMKCSFSLCELTFLKVIRPVMRETAVRVQKAFEKISKHQQERVDGPVDLDIESVFTVELEERIDPAMKKRKGNRGPASSASAPPKRKVVQPIATLKKRKRVIATHNRRMWKP
ncbi:unnamed protein product [Orchesella dallaii]|uniref:C2H2-type domain-containing protein n=1 Tax=Orchesella dallaii TaxID=48710 RepID=A0ABP1PQC0_9HEXA